MARVSALRAFRRAREVNRQNKFRSAASLRILGIVFPFGAQKHKIDTTDDAEANLGHEHLATKGFPVATPT